jgi:hypothetical protein
MSAEPAFVGEAQLAVLQQRALRRRFAAFKPKMLTWLAALPAWTVTLGVRLGLDRDADLVAALVSDLQGADLIESRQILSEDGQPIEAFWLRPSVRPELGRYLQESDGSSLDKDLDTLADAVAELQAAPATTGALGSTDWLKIVRDFRPDHTGRVFIGQIDRLIERGQLALASGLVAGARSIGELASGTLLDAARWAQWRIDGAIRVEQDRERLRHYIGHPDVEQAIEHLMGGSAQTWALHLLGDGGVGKTTLIRYLASGRFAADHQQTEPFLVTRVDFDRLDPRYPHQRPAQLLLALGTELEPFVAGRELDRLYRGFQDAANLLHERLAGQHADDGEADLRQAVERFGRFLSALERPVLFVLDTCEELAKLYTPQTAAPAIDETFRILHLVHDQVTSTRVLFAGRRWLVPSDDPGRRASGPLLRPRDYLRVLPVSGFSLAQAEHYINLRENARLTGDAAASPLDLALREAMLDRCRASSAPTGPASYSPFELSAYCDWVPFDPDIDAARLRSAPGDPYVEWRIVGKLGDAQVRTALGIVAQLGRFDRALVSPALARTRLDAARVFDSLAAQEWMNVVSVGPDGRPAVIEVDEHLRGRIRRVTERSPDLYPVDRAQLGEDARQVIVATQLDEVPAETVTVAVEMLPVESAAELWRLIDDRIAAERAWGWLDQIASRVRAAEQQRLAGDSQGSASIMAAIIASQACARIQTRSGPDLFRLWREVELYADRFPEDQGREILTLRAGLGRLAVGDLDDTPVLVAALRADSDVREMLTGAIVAAAHGLIGRGDEVWRVIGDLLDNLAVTTADPAAQAALHLVGVVLRLRDRKTDEAAGLADLTIELADRAARQPGQPWPDWATPRRFPDHCRLVRMIVAWRQGAAIDAVPWPAWRAAALPHIADIDAERLVAATVRFEAGYRVIEPGDLERLGQAERYVANRRSSAWAHAQVEPLVAELADVWQVRGAPDRCADLLQARIEEAVAIGDDPDTIEQCEFGLLRLCRRERNASWSSSVRRLSLEGSPRQREAAWLVRILVDGDRPRTLLDAGSWPLFADFGDSTAAADGGVSSVPTGSVASGGGAYDFDPVHDLRIEINIKLPPAARGRAVIATSETDALRRPKVEAPVLMGAAQDLVRAGDEQSACEAILLARLAWARADERSEAEDTGPLAFISADAKEAFARRPGWRARAEALDAYLSRRPLPSEPSSPELLFPARRRWQRRLLSLTEIGASVTLAAGVGASIAGIDVGAALAEGIALAALLVVRQALRLLPYQFGAARAINVSENQADQQVTASSAPSRGARDLTGLSVRTVLGALVGLWPVRTMFFPWHGSWQERLPSEPPLAFDLRGLGLRLPASEFPRRLTTIEIVAADEECQRLPWEQWLGASQPADRAADLIWFRRVDPRRAQRTWTGWRRATAEYHGPRHLAPTRLRHVGGWASVEPPEYRVIYIVCAPVPTSAGWRLRVSDDIGESASSGSSRSRNAGEELLSVDQLPLRRTDVAVLQADPVDGQPQSLGDQRAGFMGSAQDLLAAGAGAVLVIPPLPDQVCAEAVRTIWRRVAERRTPVSAMSLLRTAARLKRLIAEASPEPDGSESAVLDVLLFLRTANKTGE